MKNIVLNKYLFLLFLSQMIWAQNSDREPTNSIHYDSIYGNISVNTLYNSQSLSSTFEKMDNLSKGKKEKLRIVHIGDSHIQADLFTGKMRTLFQDKFGNGGLGFSFPYRLAKTNGNSFVKYTISTSQIESLRNVFAAESEPVGISGISFKILKNETFLGIQVNDEVFNFNKIKVFTPHKENSFDLLFDKEGKFSTKIVEKHIYHKIKSGENLSGIASKYNVSILDIKRANGLRKNNIYAGKKLIIPSYEKQVVELKKEELNVLITNFDKGVIEYSSELPLNQITLATSQEKDWFAINGILLENNEPGVVYSSIGVNGAKAIDYNKFPLFFEQLSGLEPDMVIVSLGTNESFERLGVEAYFYQMQKLIETIRNKLPNVEILLTTPPPSLFKRRYPNTFVVEYTEKIIKEASENNYAVWNLYEALGGVKSVNKNYSKGYMAKDKVHYSKLGYEVQAELFFKAIMNSF